MPRLEASMHELPAKVNIGELNRVVLELYNPSKVPIKVSCTSNCETFTSYKQVWVHQ